MRERALWLIFGCLIGGLWASLALAQSGTVFTYQGRLLDTSTPANGSYELQFRLYNVAGGGAPLGTYTPPAAISVVQGLLNVPVDFGALFVGADLYLEVSVRAAGAPAYTTLVPRQRITPAPGAMYAQLAAVAGADSVNALSITDGSVGAADINTAAVQRRSDQMGTACATANLSIKTIAPDGTVTCEADDTAVSGWGLSGNAGTNPATNYLGTSDNTALTLRVNNAAALRLLPTASIPTVIAGSSLNTSGGAEGATISGGGEFGGNPGNQALDSFAVVGGGGSNVASGASSTVAGGIYNTASGTGAFVSGGATNCAGAAFSWAGGRSAQVRPGSTSGAPGVACGGIAPPSPEGDSGTFVWADGSTAAPFTSTGPNQFLVRAQGGMAINSAFPFPNSTITAVPLTAGGSVLTFSTTGSNLNADQGGSIELGANATSVPPPNQTPFIDFHYSPATPFAEDFNVRLVNDVDRQLTVVGTLKATGDLTTDNNVNVQTGRVYIGSISGPPVDPTNRLYVNGSALKPLGGLWGVLSDARVKHDIREIESPLDRVLSLHGITFEYNADAGPMAVPGRHIGFIAQEVERVFPDWITEDEKGIKTVNIHGFESLLVEAIRELKARHDVEVEALRADNDSLRSDNVYLRGRLDRIESVLRLRAAE